MDDVNHCFAVPIAENGFYGRTTSHYTMLRERYSATGDIEVKRAQLPAEDMRPTAYQKLTNMASWFSNPASKAEVALALT